MADTTKIFTAINGVTLAGSAFTDSTVKNIYNARSVMLTMRKTGNSTSMVYTVYTSPDGTDVDTETYQTFTISGAGTKQLTRPVTVGANSMLIRVTNADPVVGNAGVVTVKYVPIYGR